MQWEILDTFYRAYNIIRIIFECIVFAAKRGYKIKLNSFEQDNNNGEFPNKDNGSGKLADKMYAPHRSSI